MLQMYGLTKILASKEFPVASGNTITAEGLVLVQAFEDGVEKVKPATGADGEIYVGFSYGSLYTPITKSIVEEFIVPAAAPFTVTLQHAPLAGQIRVADTSAAVNLTPGAVSNATEFAVAGNVVSFNASRASHSVQVTYRFAPTALDLMLEDQIQIASFTASDMISSTGTIMTGDIYTNIFDASVDWSAATEIRMGAGGVVTDQHGTGEVIPGAYVCGIPSAQVPFLGIRKM